MQWDYLTEIAGLLGRWLHVLAAIAWIGSSFYFVWLDNSLTPPRDKHDGARGVFGELWSIHGGGFYHAQKYPLGPAQLPDKLHWFMWEAYTTFLSGLFMLVVVYYAHASSMLVDPDKVALSPATAIGLSLLVLVGGWLVYDGLCRLFEHRSQLLFGAVYFAFVMFCAWTLFQVFPGRAVYLHIGAMIATSMSANVLFWIIPGQRKMVAAIRAGESPDPRHGLLGKQRSVHNNYLTLPVVFCMISNHYAFTYGSSHALSVLALILLSGASIRHFFNRRHHGVLVWHYIGIGIALLFIAFWLAMPAPVQIKTSTATPPPDLAQVQPIITTRCVACHSAHPRLMAAAPLGLRFDTGTQIRRTASRIVAMAGQTRVMPPGNVTGITPNERKLLLRWAAGGYR